MAVQGFGPVADSRYSREAGTEEQHRRAVLRERAWTVRQQAEETVAHSKELRWMLDDGREQTLTSRDGAKGPEARSVV